MIRKYLITTIMYLLFAFCALGFDYYSLQAEENNGGGTVVTNQWAQRGRYVELTNTNESINFMFHLRGNAGSYQLWERIAENAGSTNRLSWVYQPTDMLILDVGEVTVSVSGEANLFLDAIIVTDDLTFNPNNFEQYTAIDDWTPLYTNRFKTSTYRDFYLGWEPPTEDQVASTNNPCIIVGGTNEYEEVLTYRIHWDTTPKTYRNTVDAGTNTICEVFGLPTDEYIYFSVVAISETNGVSDYSCELQCFPRLPPLIPSHPSGSYGDRIDVTFTNNAWVQSTIYYTLDGSSPYTNSMVYTGPITITNSMTLNVQSDYHEDYTNTYNGITYTNSIAPSFMQSFTYTISPVRPGGVSNFKRVN